MKFKRGDQINYNGKLATYWGYGIWKAPCGELVDYDYLIELHAEARDDYKCYLEWAKKAREGIAWADDTWYAGEQKRRAAEHERNAQSILTNSLCLIEQCIADGSIKKEDI